MNSIITPPPLESIGAQTLMEEVLEQRPWLIDGLLPIPSTALLCSPPKYGKSLLSLKAGHCVATGSDFLNKKVEQAGVAYLCLEDQAHRLQQRLWQLTDESSDQLRLITRAETLGHGLIEQMQRFLKDHEDTRLFIIDTLQITRDSTTDYSYASDYADLRKYKSFADDNNVCVLIVHHLRKAESTNDQFMDISGTTAISGAVDEMMVMKKASRSSHDCKLLVTGRDVEYTEIRLKRDGVNWEFVEQLNEDEALSATIPDIVKQSSEFVRARGTWTGASSELLSILNANDVTPAVLGKQLSQHHEWLLSQGVRYRFKRTGSTRCITLERIDG